jgi:hypothetical protein
MVNSYTLGMSGAKPIEGILAILNDPSIPKIMGYTITGAAITNEEESQLNQAGWVISSRQMATIGEAPMETEWTYWLVKTK